jgi:tetratricopeptide (TPR) repeat protein
MDNRFESNGGTQNTGQGDGAVGQQNNTAVTQEVRGDGNIFSGTGDVTVNKYYNISEVRFDELKDHLCITDLALRNFFKILEENQVPRDDLDNKLREIAGQYKELLLRLETVQSEDPQVQRLKEEAGQAIEAADYAKAEELLKQAEARDVQAIEQLEEAIRQQQDAARQRRISAADTNVSQALAQRMQLRYAKAAEYWQKAAALLPEDRKKERAYYLGEAGYDFHRVARYNDALPLFERSVAIFHESGSKAEEGALLNNISQIYDARGDYTTALKYLEQSLVIRQEIGDKAGEGAMLNNISQIYDARGDYATALKYMEQSLVIHREVGNRAMEGTTLSNIGALHHANAN